MRAVDLGATLAITLAVAAGAARAEGPMLNDDAGTLAQGKFKVEAVWNKLDTVSGNLLAFGIAPTATLELGLFGAQAKDSAGGANSRGEGLSAKWVPYAEGEVTAGFKIDYARTRLAGLSTTDTTLTVLLTWRPASGTVMHINGGRARRDAGAGTQSRNIYGLGFELPLGERAQLTAEVQRDAGSKTDIQQFGGRWEVLPGLKIYAARAKVRGQPADKTLGFAYEF